jgi:hypothetical protein
MQEPDKNVLTREAKETDMKTIINDENREEFGSRAPLGLVIAGVASLLMAEAAHAVPVSIIGGFTSFDGTVFGSETSFIQRVNGTTMCPTSGCAEVGDAHLDFATPQQTVVMEQEDAFGIETYARNRVLFIPAAAQEVSGTGLANRFLLGTLAFENGIWSDGPRLGFTLTTQSSDPLYNGHTYTDFVQMVVTPNSFGTGSPEANADFIHFVSSPQAGSLRAFELQDSPGSGNFVTAQLFGYIGSLHLSVMADATGGGFIDPGVGLAPTPSSVPEPSTAVLFGMAGIGLLLARRRSVRG